MLNPLAKRARLSTHVAAKQAQDCEIGGIPTKNAFILNKKKTQY